jgi:hypothetical protein
MVLLIAQFRHCSEQSGGAVTFPATYTLSPLMDPPGSARQRAWQKEPLAISSLEYFANFMASGTHKCGTQLKILISFMSLSGSTELDLDMLDVICAWDWGRGVIW